MPWANGGGITTELFAQRNAQSGRILWRISMAGVASDGPFSHFAEYDRVLVLTKGQGLRLSHGDGTEHYLTDIYDLATFAGDADTRATLLSGPIQDFNVITDRAAFKSTVTVIRDGQNNRVPTAATLLAIYAVDNDLLITDPDKGEHLVQRGDLFPLDAPQQGDWTMSGATAIVTQLLQLGESYLQGPDTRIRVSGP